jgi:hypothetical protein
MIGMEPSPSDSRGSNRRHTHNAAYTSMHICIIAILYLLRRRTSTLLFLVGDGVVPSDYTSLKHTNLLVDLFDRLEDPSGFYLFQSKSLLPTDCVPLWAWRKGIEPYNIRDIEGESLQQSRGQSRSRKAHAEWNNVPLQPDSSHSRD